MQCPNCDRRVSRNKNGAIALHYIEDFVTIGWAQRKCPAVGSANGKLWSASVKSNASKMRCRKCDALVQKKKDGRMRVHNDGGRECPASVANR